MQAELDRLGFLLRRDGFRDAMECAARTMRSYRTAVLQDGHDGRPFILLRCRSIDAAYREPLRFQPLSRYCRKRNNDLPHRKACALSGKTATVTQDCSIALGSSSENRSQDQMLADMPMMQTPWLAAVREKAHGS
jgi:hypothetical protein